MYIQTKLPKFFHYLINDIVHLDLERTIYDLYRGNPIYAIDLRLIIVFELKRPGKSH